MPTGYTADVQDGKITDLRPFALQCARAFGALITMRDDPMDAVLPAKILPSRYHEERLAEEEDRHRMLLSMSPDEIAIAAEADFMERLSSWVKRREDAALYRERYQAMIDKVHAWHPPEICFGLRDFMVQIDHDCHVSDKYDPKPVKQESEAWLKTSLESVRHDIEYHAKEWQKEQARASENTLWLDALRVSLI